MMERVKHQKYGRGTVELSRYYGFQKYVQFDNGIAIWLNHDDLIQLKNQDVQAHSSSSRIPQTVISPNRPMDTHKTNVHVPHKPSTHPTLPNVSVPKKITRSPPESKQFEMRSIIEAFRLGGVPLYKVDNFHCGRQEELNIIQDWLVNGEGCLRIEGEYGVGKSHLLEMSMNRALHDGWCVATIGIDPNEYSFHKPKNLYQGMIRSFSFIYEGRVGTFRDFIRLLITSNNHISVQKIKNHPFIGLLFKLSSASNQLDERIQNWIEGEGGTYSHMPRLYDTQVAANIYCNIISGLGWAAANILNMKGLLILFDEAESLDKSWYTSYQFKKSENTLRGLIMMANDDIDCRIESIVPLTSGYGRSAGQYGEKTNLQYCGQSRRYYPFLWEAKSHVKMIFSFVPGMIDAMSKNLSLFLYFNEIPQIQLDHLQEKDYHDLYKKILSVYATAYDYSTGLDFFNYLPKNKTRTFVKSTVEALDLFRFYPGIDPDEMLVRYD